MKKQIVLAACVAAISCAGFAQTTVETERRVTTVQTGSGSVTTVETHTVVRTYVSYLYETYRAVNIPEAQIVQLIALDLQILDARVRGDWDQVRVYIDRQVELVGPPVVQRIHTHVQSHPVPASMPVYARPVWVDNVRVDGSDVNINVDVNRTEIKQAVEQNNISVEQLNVDKAVERVRSGDIEKLATAPDNKTAESDPVAGKDVDAPKSTPAPGETPAVKTDEDPANTLRANETPAASPTPRANADSNAAATPAAAQPADVTQTPSATPANRNSATPPAGSAATPSNNTTPANNTAPGTTNATPAANSSAPGQTNSTPAANRAPGQTNSTPPANRAPGQTNATPAPGSSSNAASGANTSGNTGSASGTGIGAGSGTGSSGTQGASNSTGSSN